MTDMLDLDIDYIKECFVYEASSGCLFWKQRPLQHFASLNACAVWNSKHAGAKAGSPNIKKRWSTKIKNKLYQNHRLVWALVHGVWPADQLDHINGDPEDNRIENLRVVSNTENQKNRWRSHNNTSGVNGVYWHTRDCVWNAHIRVDGRQRSLGTFPSQAQAIVARKAAEQRLGYTARHGESKSA